MAQSSQPISAQAWAALPDAPSTRRNTNTSDAGGDSGVIRGAMNTAKDVGVGALKGAGETAFDLGNLVHSIPGIGNITDAIAKLLGPAGTDPNAAFAHSPEALRPSNTAQSIGRGGEQIGEFLLPGGAASDAAVKGLSKILPDAAGKTFVNMGRATQIAPSATAKALGTVAPMAGRMAGEAGSAAAVGALHGDPNVDREAGIASAGPLLSGGLSAALQNPGVEKALAILLAGVPTGALPVGLAGRMGSFGLIRKTIEDMLRSGPIQAMPKRVPLLTRAAAGASSIADTEQQR